MASVLIVFDDRFLADDLGFFLSEAGHSCSIARGAIEAIGLIEKTTFEIFVLDKMMPMPEALAEGVEIAARETGEWLLDHLRKVNPDGLFIVVGAKGKDDLRLPRGVKFYPKPLDEMLIQDLVDDANSAGGLK